MYYCIFLWVATLCPICKGANTDLDMFDYFGKTSKGVWYVKEHLYSQIREIKELSLTHRFLIETLWHTGGRKSEVLAIKKKDLDGNMLSMINLEKGRLKKNSKN
jgi:integrase